MFHGEWGQDQEELVAVTLTPTNEWSPVRRVPLDAIGMNQLVLSDGRVENVWREADAGTVRAHIGDQMLVGP